MKSGLLVAVVVAAAVCGVASAQQSARAATSLVFDGVTVVDVEQGKLVPNQRVVIVGNRIQVVGGAHAVAAPNGARIVDARGKYLIPGLWDMHVHLCPCGSVGVDSLPFVNAQRTYAIFLAYGVTGVRDMMYRFPHDSLRRWRRAVAAGAEVGPRVIGGTYVTIRDTRAPQVSVRTPADARRVVDSLKAAGADFIKFHTFTHGKESSGEGPDPRATYFAIAAEARRVGLPLTGHPPGWGVTLAESSDAGQRSLEHFTAFEDRCWQPDSVGEAHCVALAARLVRNATWLTPTLTVGTDTSLRSEPGWYERYVRDTVGDNKRFVITNGLWFVRRAGRVGLPLLAGTDAYLFAKLQGDYINSNRRAALRIHRELALFVEAGLPPIEALRTATLNPAKYFGATDSLGTVASGKLADLVLLDADPLADITNTTRIRAVVANGRYFDRADLDQLLGEVHAKAKQQP